MLKINKILSKNGFSLIELMVAVVILALVIFGIFLAFTTGFQGMADARDRTVATNYAREAMEDVKNMDFEYIASIPLEDIGGTKYTREVSVEENIEGSPNLKKITVRVFWDKRNGESLNIETSMLINKIEFLPGVASKLLLYVTPYNIILPNEGSVNLIAVVKDAKGNTVTNWNEDITFSIMNVTCPVGANITCYLKNDEEVTGQTMAIEPINGTATVMLYTGDTNVLDADEIGNIEVSATISSVETGTFSDSVNIKVTQGAVKIGLTSYDESIKINESTTINAELQDANGDKVLEGEAEIFFNVSGDGTLAEPLNRTTMDQQTSIILTASNAPGVATVTASANNLLSDSLPIFITGPPFSIFVSVSPNHIYTDQFSLVTATLKDINGVTVDAESDVNISFSLSLDLGEFTDNSITISSGNPSGSTTFTPTGIGNSTIQAQATDAELIDGEAAITIDSALVADHIEVSAEPTSIKAGGSTPSIITAVIKSAEPENATVYNYTGDIFFETTEGSFSATDSGKNEIWSYDTDVIIYQNGVVKVNLYSHFGDTSEPASITVTSVGLTEGTVEVGFYVEADHIELTSDDDTIDSFGVLDDTCTITATIMDGGSMVENYIGTVIFSIVDGENNGQFIPSGSTIVTVVNGTASIDLRGKCPVPVGGDVVVHAVSTFGETEISSESDQSSDLSINVTGGAGRSINLVSGSLQQPSKNEVIFEINNTGVALKIYNLQVTCVTDEKLTEIKIGTNIVYSGSVSDGDVVYITPTVLSSGAHEIYFGYTKKVDNNNFEIIFNAEPDCELFTTIEFSTIQ